MNGYERYIRDSFARSGIEFNGSNPWDIKVHDQRLFRRMVWQGTFGFAEAYLDRWWECDDLEEFMYRVYRTRAAAGFKLSGILTKIINAIHLLSAHSMGHAGKYVNIHYDLSNRFFEYVLGPSMVYTCAYWKNAKTLEEAQYSKFDLVCRKMKLTASDRVLELGGGFGSFAKYASAKYGCHIVFVNIGPNQCDYAREQCRDLPVTVCNCDYRDIDQYNQQREKFDKVIAIGLGEHIGGRFMNSWFALVNEQLKDGGLFFTHQVGVDVTRTRNHPFNQKYIFPNALTPSMKQFSTAAESVGFAWQDFHDIGKHYYPTLREWYHNLLRHKDDIRNIDAARFDDRYFRIWDIYLCGAMANARARIQHLWHLVFSKGLYEEEYETVR